MQASSDTAESGTRHPLVRAFLSATALVILAVPAQAEVTYFDANIMHVEPEARGASVGQVMIDGAYEAEKSLGNAPAYDYQLLAPLLDDMISDVFVVLASRSNDGRVDIDDYEVWKSHYGADLNRDGAVEGRDFALWRDSLGAVVVPPAGANDDGWVDAADYLVWRDTSSANSSDYNRDGLVDAADYTVWRDTSSASASDYNRDGFVDAADYVVWAVDDRDFSIWQMQYGSAKEYLEMKSRDASAEWRFCAGIPETLMAELESVRTTGTSGILGPEAIGCARVPVVNAALVRLVLLCLVDPSGEAAGK